MTSSSKPGISEFEPISRQARAFHAFLLDDFVAFDQPAGESDVGIIAHFHGARGGRSVSQRESARDRNQFGLRVEHALNDFVDVVVDDFFSSCVSATPV